VYRQHLFNIGVTDAIGPNSYSLYGFYTEQQSLTPPISAPTKSIGVNFGYSRDIRPDLSGSASISYVNSVNSPTSLLGVATTENFNATTGNFNTATATL